MTDGGAADSQLPGACQFEHQTCALCLKSKSNRTDAHSSRELICRALKGGGFLASEARLARARGLRSGRLTVT